MGRGKQHGQSRVVGAPFEPGTEVEVRSASIAANHSSWRRHPSELCILQASQRRLHCDGRLDKPLFYQLAKLRVVFNKAVDKVLIVFDWGQLKAGHSVHSHHDLFILAQMAATSSNSSFPLADRQTVASPTPRAAAGPRCGPGCADRQSDIVGPKDQISRPELFFAVTAVSAWRRLWPTASRSRSFPQGRACPAVCRWNGTKWHATGR